MTSDNFVYLKLVKTDFELLSDFLLKKNKKLHNILNSNTLDFNNLKHSNIENARNVRTYNIKNRLYLTAKDLLAKNMKLSQNKLFIETQISKTTIRKYYKEICLDLGLDINGF